MQQQQQIRIDLSDSTSIECSHCNGVFLTQTFVARKWSRVLTGTPQDHVDLVPVFRCADCGEIFKEFFPQGMNDLEQRFGLNKQPTLTFIK